MRGRKPPPEGGTAESMRGCHSLFLADPLRMQHRLGERAVFGLRLWNRELSSSRLFGRRTTLHRAPELLQLRKLLLHLPQLRAVMCCQAYAVDEASKTG
jgi:hypothetical protein